MAKLYFWQQIGNKECPPKPITVAVYLENISRLHPTKLWEKVKNLQEMRAKSCKPLYKSLDWTHQEEFYNKKRKNNGVFLYTTLEYYYTDWLMRFITPKMAVLLFLFRRVWIGNVTFYCQVSRQRHIKTWPLMRLDGCSHFTVFFHLQTINRFMTFNYKDIKRTLSIVNTVGFNFNSLIEVNTDIW